MANVSIIRKKNIPFQKTPVILLGGNKNNKADKPYYSWNETNPFLIKIRKDNEDYFPAPWYAYFENGSLVKEIDLSKLEFTTKNETFSVYEQKGIEVVPYLPKTSDGYYVGNDDDVFFTAEKDFDLTIIGETENKRPWEVPNYETIHYDFTIGSYKQGQNINEVTCNLLKLTYDLYIYRKVGLNRITHEDTETISNEIYKKPQIFGTPTYVTTIDYNRSQEMTGHFTATGSFLGEHYEKSITWHGGILCNRYGCSLIKPIIPNPLCAPYPQYQVNEYWNGEQTISNMYSRALSSSLVDDKVGGFKYISQTSLTGNSYYDDIDNKWYWYYPIYILRKIEPIKSPITGV